MELDLGRDIMQKFIACFICILALLAAAMPVIIAEDKQNSTGNNTQNQTHNIMENVTLNETENASQNIAVSADRNATKSMTNGAGQNTTQIGVIASQHTKVLRAGFEKTKPLNNLDVYGNKSTYNIPSSGANLAFNLSQRLGNTSKITYNTNNTRPIYNVSQYSRTKPAYEVPSTLSSKPVYSISGYPVIKAPNSIP
jgi:hypothetical protein